MFSKVTVEHTPHLVPLEDFVRRRKVTQRRQLQIVLSTVAAFFAFFLLLAAATTEGNADYKWSRVISFASVVGICVSIAGSITFLIWSSGQLKCPKCNHGLDGCDAFDIVSLRRCPHCMEGVFTAWPQNTAPRPSTESERESLEMTFEDLKEHSRRARKCFLPCMTVWIVAGFTASGLMWFVSNSAAPLLVGFLGDSIHEAIRFACLAPAILLIGFGFIATERRIARQRPTCRSCGTSLQHNSILHVTGNCPSCGCLVICDPLATDISNSSSSQQLIERSSFNQLVHRLIKLRPLSCLLGLSAAVVWIVLVWRISKWIGVELTGHTRINPYVYVAMSMGVVVQGCVVLFFDFQWQRWLHCPECHEEITAFARLIQETGNCCHCGKQILAPMQPNEHISIDVG